MVLYLANKYDNIVPFRKCGRSNSNFEMHTRLRKYNNLYLRWKPRQILLCQLIVFFAIRHLIRFINKKIYHFIEYICNKIKIYFLSTKTPLPILNESFVPKTLGLIKGILTTTVYNLAFYLNIYFNNFQIEIDASFRERLNVCILLVIKRVYACAIIIERYQVNNKNICTQLGVFNLAENPKEGNIKEYHEKFGQICVIFCGGSAIFFESSIKAAIFVNQYLALIGLNKILEGL